MKFYKLIILVFVFLFSTTIIAQEKKYIPYEVQKGETLKRIAKSRDISPRTVYKLNPDVKRRPSPGTVIIIPNPNFGKVVLEEEVLDKYIAKPKETLFGISKMFGISVDELMSANPQITEGLKIGMELTIPKPTIAQEKDSVNFVIHKVIKNDTFYNLSKRYEVSEIELYKLNPNLVDGLKLNMFLKIKPIEKIEIQEEEIEEEEEQILVFEENLNLDKEIDVAVLLPYQLTKLNDSILDSNFGRKTSILNIVTDFHLGVEMAIDSLKSKGLTINTKYFDTENSEQKLQIILNQNQNFDSTDIIIGPLFYSKSLLLSKHTKTPVISPIYSRQQDSLKSVNLYRSAPNKRTHLKLLIKYLKAKYSGEKIVIVNDNRPESKTYLWQIVSELKTLDSMPPISIIKPEKGYIDQKMFHKNIDSLNNNWVILLSDERVTTSTVVNNIKGFVDNFPIKLFALNKGRNFENINNLFLSKLNFTYTTSEILDSQNPEINKFYNSFKRRNFAYPSKYAIRGFDVTYDILSRFSSHNSIDDSFNSGKSNRVSSTFDYKNDNSGGFENNGLFLIQYSDDLSINRINQDSIEVDVDKTKLEFKMGM